MREGRVRLERQMNVHEVAAGLIQLFRFEVTFLIWGTAAVVFFQMLTGKVSLVGLFADESGAFSASRVQMLMTNLIVAGTYLSHPEQIVASPSASALSTTSTGVAALMGGSNILYLVHKFRQSAT
jgi:hypothetical protein